MNGAMTNYELGKSTHREYEALFSRYWGQDLARDRQPLLTSRRRLALALRGALAGILLAAGVLVF